jgi:hypothetical protein
MILLSFGLQPHVFYIFGLFNNTFSVNIVQHQMVG